MGATPDAETVLAEVPQALIKQKARQLSRGPGFQRHEEEDLHSELTIRALQALHKFDAARGSIEAFLACVIESAGAMLARERTAQKRGGGHVPISLGGPASTGLAERHPSLADSLTVDDAGRRLGIEDRAPIGHGEVEQILAGLPEDLAAVCRNSLAGGTVASRARKCNTSRRQVRNDVALLRKRFKSLAPGDSGRNCGQPAARRHK